MRVVVTAQPDAPITHVAELVAMHTPQVLVVALIFLVDGKLFQVHFNFQGLTGLK